MSGYERPRGLKETAVAMSITNALGWAIIDWSNRRAQLVFIVFTVFILTGYVVIWFYWKGQNWARMLVLLTSLLCLYNLHFWNHVAPLERIMIGTEAVMAIFLLYWLNTRKVKAFFIASKP
jgi:hypothetical protein